MRPTRKLATAVIALPVAVGLSVTAAYGATAVDYTEIPLTQAELDANWVTDRATPSGGYESVTFDGRTDVLEVRIDPDNRSEQPSSFYYTEGIQRQVDAVAATKMDLYVDPDWSAKDVRAGFWGVGHDDSGARTGSFPIAEFTTTGEGGYEGWRVWNSLTGWENHPEIPAEYGEWATLEIVLDQASDSFAVSIDGHEVPSPALGSTNIGAVIVNSYNYGPESQAYDVHWSGFAVGALDELDSTDECRDGGHTAYGFDNQGQCVSSLRANENSGR